MLLWWCALAAARPAVAFSERGWQTFAPAVAFSARGRATTRCAAASLEGLDAESDSVGAGIYGGIVSRHADGSIVIGQQYEEHNPIPGPVYAGGGYTPMSQAIRTGPDAVAALLAESPELATEITTGSATPLHICGMSQRGQHSAQLLIDAGGDLEALDGWGYTPIQRAATNGLNIAAEALVNAGASHTRPSGLEQKGESARALARRLRSFSVLKVFQQWELAQGIPLPDGEVQL